MYEYENEIYNNEFKRVQTETARLDLKTDILLYSNLKQR